MEKISTKQVLFLSLNELSNEYPVSKITVDQIAKNCGLKRGTFYYYYKDKDDMIQKAILDHINQSYEKYYSLGSWEKLLEHAFEFSYKYHRLLRNFLRNCDWFSESLLGNFEAYITGIVAEYYKKRYNAKMPDELIGVISFYTAGSVRIYQQWINTKKPVKPEIMAHQVNLCVPECLKEAFNGGKEISTM